MKNSFVPIVREIILSRLKPWLLSVQVQFESLVMSKNFARIDVLRNTSSTRDSVSSGYPNIEKRVENTTRSGVFLTECEVFG